MSETNNQNAELKQAKESAEALAKILEQIGKACQNINAKTSAMASDISGAFGRIAGAMKAAVKEMEEFNSITMGNARGEIYETTDALYQNKQAAEGAAEAQRRLNEEKSKSPAIAPAEGIAQSGATEQGQTATDAMGMSAKLQIRPAMFCYNQRGTDGCCRRYNGGYQQDCKPGRKGCRIDRHFCHGLSRGICRWDCIFCWICGNFNLNFCY